MNTLILDSTTKSIEVKMSAAPATTNPSFITSYADNNGTTFTEKSSDGSLSGATPVTIVAAPAAGFRRIVKSVSISNNDTAPVQIIIQINNNGTARQIRKQILSIGDTFMLDHTIDINGNTKGIGLKGDTGDDLWEADGITKIKPLNAKTVDGSHISGEIYGGLFQP